MTNWYQDLSAGLEEILLEFGIQVLYHPKDKPTAFLIPAIFDREAIIEKAEWQGREIFVSEIQSYETMLFLLSRDFDVLGKPGPVQGDRVRVNGRWYEVALAEPDEHLGVDLALTKADYTRQSRTSREDQGAVAWPYDG